jgi:hypothetical protein
MRIWMPRIVKSQYPIKTCPQEHRKPGTYDSTKRNGSYRNDTLENGTIIMDKQPAIYLRVSSRQQDHASQLPDLERRAAAHDGAV